MDLIHVIAAADQNYALPLAVMVRSLAETTPTHRAVVVHILDTGLSEDARDGIGRSIAEFSNISLDIVPLSIERFDGLTPWQHITTTTYARLFIPELFPRLEKALYLDCDIAVVRDISPLYDMDLGSFSGAAAYDAGGSAVNPRFVELWPSLGIPPDMRLFNAGVFLVNNRLWRETQVAERALALLRREPTCLGNDQDALNGLLFDSILPIDIRWNQQGEAWERENTLTKDELRACQNDYRIIHYSTDVKPWMVGCPHPLAETWLGLKSRTTFATVPLLAPPPCGKRTLRKRLGEAKTRIRRVAFGLGIK
jgi:lipopolysaccharide biosynthesis glycosyltransferase